MLSSPAPHRSLPMEDQISLLKGAAVEICHIALNTTFCLQTQNFLCGPLHYAIEDGAHGETALEPQRARALRGMVCGQVTRRILSLASPTVGFQEQFLELLFRFHGTLRRLQLQEPEYVLMAAVALFSPGERPQSPEGRLRLCPHSQPREPTHDRGSVFKPSLGPFRMAGPRPTPPVLPRHPHLLPDRPGVTRREQIDHLQLVTALTLQSYIEGQQPRPGSRYGGPPGGLEATPGHGGEGNAELRGNAFTVPSCGKPGPSGARVLPSCLV